MKCTGRPVLLAYRTRHSRSLIARVAAEIICIPWASVQIDCPGSDAVTRIVIASRNDRVLRIRSSRISSREPRTRDGIEESAMIDETWMRLLENSADYPQHFAHANPTSRTWKWKHDTFIKFDRIERIDGFSLKFVEKAVFQIINHTRKFSGLFLYYVRLSCSVGVQVANKLRFISDKFDSEEGGGRSV